MWSKLLEVLNPYEAVLATNQPKNQFVDKVLNDDSCGILPPPTEPQEALNILQEYLIPDIQIADPISQAQVNTVVVHELLLRYSRKYRKQFKKNRKR